MRTPWVSAAACLLLLGACGSHSGSDAGPAGTSPSAGPAQVAALRETVQSFWDQILTGQGPNAYTFLSTRCQTIVDVAQFDELVIRVGNGYAGPPLPFVTFEARIDGERASVDYTFRLRKLDTIDDRWVRDGDEWRWDSCDHPPQHPDQEANA